MGAATRPTVRRATAGYSAGVRIAVLADVHGNLPALEAVLADAERHAVDEVIVNGDLVNRGPQGAAVVARLTSIGARLTLGNHDDLLRMLVDGDPALPDEFHRGPFWRANRWCAEELDHAGRLDALRALPMTAAVRPQGAPRVLVAHGSPRHYREGLGRGSSDATLSEILEMHPTDVLVGSHTHQPMERRWGRTLVVNSGAVGSPFNGDGRAQYVWLTLADGGWRPEFRRVAYDLRASLEAYETTGYLEAGGLLARLFRDEVRDARSYLVPFQMWAGASGEDLGEASFERFRRARPERFGPVAGWPDATASVAP
jgi:predicted phosphodiesterase